MRTELALLILVSCCVAQLKAQDQVPQALRDVRIDQNLNSQVPLDLEFRDEEGRPIKLRDCFAGKPVLLIPAYYRCPRLCTLILNGVTDSLKHIPFEIGREFTVVTFSIDPHETPQMAAAKKQSYLSFYGRPGVGKAWHFLTGPRSSIESLTEAIGYRYTHDPQTDLYAHASGIMLLTPTGVVSHYFNGIDFPPAHLRLGLVEASHGEIGSPVDQVRLFCFHYDPQSGRYTPAVMNFVRLGGMLTLIIMGALFGATWLRSARRSCRQATAESSDKRQQKVPSES